LFWGSQPFHWGMLILFLGHLVAFLIPNAIIAWNGDPLRLLILEISAFAFGLSALLGLILLVKRRLASQRLTMVANKMDMPQSLENLNEFKKKYKGPLIEISALEKQGLDQLIAAMKDVLCLENSQSQ